MKFKSECIVYSVMLGIASVVNATGSSIKANAKYYNDFG